MWKITAFLLLVCLGELLADKYTTTAGKCKDFTIKVSQDKHLMALNTMETICHKNGIFDIHKDHFEVWKKNPATHKGGADICYFARQEGKNHGLECNAQSGNGVQACSCSSFHHS